MAPAKLSRSPAGTSQPCSPCWISSGMPATNVVMTGLRNAMASMMTTGRPSAKLGNTSARAARISAANLVAADPACYPHSICQPVFCDERLDLAAHFAVAGEHQFELRPAFRQQPRRLDQEQLPLLFTQRGRRRPIAVRRPPPWRRRFDRRLVQARNGPPLSWANRNGGHCERAGFARMN